MPRMTMQEFEREQSLAMGGPAIGAWPRRPGEQLRPHKGGGDPGAEARRQEEERQQRIKAATDQINRIFNGQEKRMVTKQRYIDGTPGVNAGWVTQDIGDQPTPVWQEGKAPVPGRFEDYQVEEWVTPATNPREALYEEQRNAVFDLNKREVDRQATEAERANRFALARSGLLGGSANIDSVADINRRTNEGLLKAGGIADAASAELKQADETTRANLINMAQSGIDTGSASKLALEGLRANAMTAQGARAGASIGGLFNDLSQAYLASQGRPGGASPGQQQGQQWYGVSSPSQRYGGNTTR